MRWRSVNARKHISALLALVMCFSMVPGAALASAPNAKLPTPSAEGVETFDWAPEIVWSIGDGTYAPIGAWAPDRYPPAAFERVEDFDATHGGVARLAISGEETQTDNYQNTQGVTTAIPTSESIAVDLYVGADDEGAQRRMGIWGQLPSTEFPGDPYWPIIEFASRPNDATTTVGFRVYDINTGAWDWADTVVQFGAWYRLEIRAINDVVRYYIDGDLVTIDGEPALYPAAGNLGMQAIHLQAFNFGQDYDVYYDNIVPGPINYPRIATFADYDSSVLTSQSVHWNTKVDTSTVPAPTREHYTFEGWSPVLDTTVTVDTTFTAQYEGVDYTVAFVDHDGTVLSTPTVTYPEKAVEPSDPSRDGYTFTGWYSADATEPWSFDTTITADTTLTAEYEINKYFFTFQKSATDSEPATAVAEWGATVAEPSVEPTKTGYTFAGWYLVQGTESTVIDPNNADDALRLWSFETTMGSSAYNTLASTYPGAFTDLAGYEDAVNLRAGFAPVYTVAIDNGTTVATVTATYPDYLVAEPSDPTTIDKLFTYWQMDGATGPFDFTSKITADSTLTAQFGVPRTVTFMSRTGEYPNLSSYTVYGDLQSVGDGGYASKPATPTATGWDFAGWYTENYGEGELWDFANDEVTASMQLFAHFTAHQWNVKFVGWDSGESTISVLASVPTTHSLVIAEESIPSTPTRTGYTFDGWFQDATKWNFDTTITADTTLTAKYTPLKYKVAFVDYDGKVLSTTTVDMDSVIPAASTEPDPTREGWKFTGWKSGVVDWNLPTSTVTTDTTLTAQYEINEHKVTFLDWDESVYTSQTVEYGSVVDTPTPDPVRDHYTFDGWFDGATKWSFTTTVTADTTLTAGFTADTYKVTFVDHDDTVIETSTVVYPGKPTAPLTDPTRADYTFTDWTPSLDATVTADTTFTAQYVPNMNVAFVNGVTGSTIATDAVGSGFPIPEPVDPTLDGYRFIDWFSPADAAEAWSFDTTITADTTLTAKFMKTYVVTFNDWDATELKVQTVDTGDDAVAPVAPVRTGYTFTGWDKAYTNVTTDTVVTAEYDINTYTVTFKDWDGTTLKTQTVDYNTAATAPTAPTRTGYTFTGWDREFTNVTSNLIVVAQYEPIVVPVTYTVTFQDFDGTVLKTQTGIASGAAATAPADPVRDGYTFTGWDRDFSNVTSNLLVKALYTPVVVPPVEVDVIRHAGADRFATAAQAALYNFSEGADIAIVAYGRDFADALSAAGLAGAADAPVLLTETATLSPVTKAALETLGVTKIYIVGGTGVVSTAVETALNDIAGVTEVERLGGSSRYDTSKLIADEVVAIGGNADAVFVVRGDNFADALAVSSIATQMEMPVLLTAPTALSAQVAAFITANGVDDAYIAGGTGAVSADVETALAALTAVERWDGINRYATGAAVIRGSIAEFGIGYAYVGIANGEDYPDALVGGPALGAVDGVLLLTTPTALHPETLDLLADLAPEVIEAEILGGTGALSAGVETSVKVLLQ